MKKAFCITLLFVVLISNVNISLASILYDPVFFSAYTYLSTSKSAQFSADTNEQKSSIMVTRVQLYKMNGSSWQLIGDLPVPSDEATNTNMYDSDMNYSNNIGSGTYRLYTTFCADGYSISRYSNTRTY